MIIGRNDYIQTLNYLQKNYTSYILNIHLYGTFPLSLLSSKKWRNCNMQGPVLLISIVIVSLLKDSPTIVILREKLVEKVGNWVYMIYFCIVAVLFFLLKLIDNFAYAFVLFCLIFIVADFLIRKIMN